MPEKTRGDRDCTGTGYIVGPRLRVPQDTAYFQTYSAGFIVGCNQLRCNLCGTMVRQQPGLRDGPDAVKHARAIYDEQDMSKSPHVLPDADSRLYACGCSLVIVTGQRAAFMPNGTWSCTGHPPVPGSPMVLPTISIDAANDFVLKIMNSGLQSSISRLLFTFTDGGNMVARPAGVSLGGGGYPSLSVLVDEYPDMAMQPDFRQIAGACVELTDNSLWPF